MINKIELSDSLGRGIVADLQNKLNEVIDYLNEIATPFGFCLCGASPLHIKGQVEMCSYWPEKESVCGVEGCTCGGAYKRISGDVIQEVCEECGISANVLTCLQRFGRRPYKLAFDSSTFHIDVCDCCGEEKPVTGVRDFLYPDFSLLKRYEK